MTRRFIPASLAAVVALCLVQIAHADDDAAAPPTFYKDVLPVFQNACQACHRPEGLSTGGMVAPMSLMTYEEARPWAKSISKEVKARRMPPWSASSEFHGVFSNERSLTDAEAATIVRWADGGAPAGEATAAPAAPIFKAAAWSIGEPDLIVPMPKPYTVKDDVEDQYINFTTEITKEMLPGERWIKSMEFKGGSKVVHHIILYAIPPGAKGGPDRGMLGGVAPGNDPDVFPEGYGVPLVPGTKLVFAMHYHKDAGAGTAVEDVSRVAFKFHEKPAAHRLRIDAIGNHEFEIPAGHPNWEVGAARVFEHDTTIVKLMPHMHLRGRDAKYVAFYPDGTKETLLNVPKYDFNWQISYEFKEPKRIPAGTRIEVMMHFDNSKGNAANPDAGKSIRFGGPTTDEMMLGWLTYSSTNPADDNPGARGDGEEVADAR